MSPALSGRSCGSSLRGIVNCQAAVCPGPRHRLENGQSVREALRPRWTLHIAGPQHTPLTGPTDRAGSGDSMRGTTDARQHSRRS